MPLTPRKRLFVREYLVDKNATQAAIRAGYSKKTAYAQGCRLLKDAEVRPEIDAGLAKLEEDAGVRAVDVLRELKRIALVDIGKAFKDDGTLKPIGEIPEDVRRAMGGIDVEETFEGYGENREWTGYLRKVKLIDKNRALELLGKHLGLLDEKVDHRHTGTINVVDPYAEAK